MHIYSLRMLRYIRIYIYISFADLEIIVQLKVKQLLKPYIAQKIYAMHRSHVWFLNVQCQCDRCVKSLEFQIQMVNLY